MRIISSRQTFFLKWIWPGVMAACLVSPGVLLAMAMVTTHAFALPELMPPMLVGMLGFVIYAVYYKMKIHVLADEVKDGGDFLVVRRGHLEDRIQLADVTNVTIRTSNMMLRMTLRLRTPCKFGDEVVFVPPEMNLLFPLFPTPLRNTPVYEGLMRRIDRAHRGAR